jgi:hypothetical protein
LVREMMIERDGINVAGLKRLQPLFAGGRMRTA